MKKKLLSILATTTVVALLQFDNVEAAMRSAGIGIQTSDIGVTVEAWDADLDAIAALAKTDNGVIIGNGTTFVLESGATLKTSLGLTIGTDIQAYDADLTTWAGITPGSNVGTFLGTPSSANLRSALTDEVNSGSVLFTPIAGESGLYKLIPHVTNRFYLTAPIGSSFTAVNTAPLVDDVLYAVLQITAEPITISTVNFLTSSSNASVGANVKIGIYAADGANGTPGTRLGLKTAATSVGDAALSTLVTATMDSAVVVPAGAFYIGILQDSTTGVRCTQPATPGAFVYATVTGATSAAGIYGGTGVTYGYTMAQSYATGLPTTFTSGGEINSATLACVYVVEID